MGQHTQEPGIYCQHCGGEFETLNRLVQAVEEEKLLQGCVAVYVDITWLDQAFAGFSSVESAFKILTFFTHAILSSIVHS
jgi:hypothetical protein